MFLSAVKEANRRKLDADRNASAATKRLEAIASELEQFPGPDELSARKKALQLAQAALLRYTEFTEQLSKISVGIDQINNYDRVISEGKVAAGPPEHLRTLVNDLEVKRAALDTLTYAISEVNRLTEDVGYTQEIVDERHAEYEKLLAEKPDEYIVCPKCGEKISV